MKYDNKLIDSKVEELKELALNVEEQFSAGVAIYGAGVVGTWALTYLRSIGAKVECFIDRDSAKRGTRIEKCEIITPDDLQSREINAILVAARHAVPQVKQALGEENYQMISFDGYFVIRNYERLCKIRDSYFTEEKSIEVFNAILWAMLTGTLESCRDVMEKDMYFSLPEFSATFDEIFVDVGAFVGDTVESFIWENLGTFRHIHAFEPGKRQFSAMQIRMKRLSAEWAFDMDRISLVNAGLSSEVSEMTCTFVEDYPIRHGLVASEDENSNKSDEVASVLTLDSYLDGKEVTFLKVDIEGMEMKFLKGARETIQQYRPKIAICVYHYPSDLYEIAEYLRDLVPEYKFKIRQHVPIFGDFVLYCYE